MGKDTSQTIGYRYRLGVFALICQWVPDYLKQIRFSPVSLRVNDARCGLLS